MKDGDACEILLSSFQYEGTCWVPAVVLRSYPLLGECRYDVRTTDGTERVFPGISIDAMRVPPAQEAAA